MTPKEKADELKNQFDMVIYTDQNQDDQVKRCAFKSANETWKSLCIILDNQDIFGAAEFIIKEEINFWADVNAELLYQITNFQ